MLFDADRYRPKIVVGRYALPYQPEPADITALRDSGHSFVHQFLYLLNSFEQVVI